jgi:hypothetical protein
LSSSSRSHSSWKRFTTPSPQSRASTVFGIEIDPGPGKPATVLIVDEPVSATQKVATSASSVVPAMPWRTMGSRKQRRLCAAHGPLPVGQPPSLVQEISGAPAQARSTGPAGHSASPTGALPICRQSGLQAPAGAPGHSASLSQGPASLLPPSQALRQAVACGWPSQKQPSLVWPAPSHGWLDGVVTVPVVSGFTGKTRPFPDTFNDELGGHCSDVGPPGPLPCTVQGGLPMTPDPAHVPASPISQSARFGLPQSQIGHGWLTETPRNACALNVRLMLAAPVLRS